MSSKETYSFSNWNYYLYLFQLHFIHEFYFSHMRTFRKIDQRKDESYFKIMKELTRIHAILQRMAASESSIAASKSSITIEAKKIDNDNLMMHLCVDTVQESNPRLDSRFNSLKIKIEELIIRASNFLCPPPFSDITSSHMSLGFVFLSTPQPLKNLGIL